MAEAENWDSGTSFLDKKFAIDFSDPNTLHDRVLIVQDKKFYVNSNVYDRSGPSFTKTETPGKWTKIDMLPTSEKPVDDWGYTFVLCDTRFSPCGRVAVNNWEKDYFKVVIIDVVNKNWFSSTIKEIKLNKVFTYYLLDAKSLVVVEMITAGSNIVRQHLIKINWLAHNAELIKTIDHEFLARAYNKPYNWEMEHGKDMLHPHVAVSLEGQEYTALLNNASERRTIYLVPKNPLNLNAKPKEFCISTHLTEELKLKLLELTGVRKVGFKMSSLSYNGLIHWIMIVYEGPHWGNIILGVYATIDVSKLIDIHQKPFYSLDQSAHDKAQVNAMNVISYTSGAQMVPTHYGRAYFSTVNNCSLIRLPARNARDCYDMFYSFKCEQQAFDTTYHVLGSPKISTVKASAISALSIHPGGSILQFHKILDSNEFSVRVVGHHKLSLQSLVKSNLTFRKYSPINAIPGLHRIMFYGLPPIDPATLPETTCTPCPPGNQKKNKCCNIL